MKILGISGQVSNTARSYIVEIRRDELLHLVKFTDTYAADQEFTPKVGDTLSINKLWNKMTILIYNRLKLKDVFDKMKNLIDVMSIETMRADFYTKAIEDD